jgi:hypothetical protein
MGAPPEHLAIADITEKKPNGVSQPAAARDACLLSIRNRMRQLVTREEAFPQLHAGGDYDLGMRKLLFDQRSSLQAAEIRHAQVEDEQIRLKRYCFFEGVPSVYSLTANGPIWPRIQGLSEAFTNSMVIVDYKYAYLCHARSRPSA